MHFMDANKTYGEKAWRQYTRMMWAILNKSWRQHPTKQQMYGHLPTITKTIQVRRTRHAGHGWRIRDEFLWTSSHRQAKAGWPAKSYKQQLCVDTECSLEVLLGAMDHRDGWWERVKKICPGGAIWWWLNYHRVYIYMCVCVVKKNEEFYFGETGKILNHVRIHQQ